MHAKPHSALTMHPQELTLGGVRRINGPSRDCGEIVDE